MKIGYILTLGLMVCLPCKGLELTQGQAVTIRNAIWRAEGGNAATFAYGVKSVSYRNLDDARAICERSIRNNYARWLESGRTNDFIPFMAIRYCPLDRAYCTRNVRFFAKGI